MSTLDDDFAQAQQDAQALPERPDNQTLLRLYALYKQATEGDIAAPAPGFFDFVGTAKHEAWGKLTGVGQESAMRQYVELVRQLRGRAPTQP